MKVPPTRTSQRAHTGALVISLDFELHWGVRDLFPADGRYTPHLLGAREVIPRLLDQFAEYGIAVTWATVGFLFAESRDELEAFHPTLRPRYADPRLDPYVEPVRESEADDPLHFAPSLIRRIQQTPRQEISTHTYSHYYCLEAGADTESFRQDIASALAIAEARGIAVRSIVLPRNQWDSRYASVLAEAGIVCYRGNQPGWMYEAESLGAEGYRKRVARLIDGYVPLTRWEGAAWPSLEGGDAPKNVPATCFFRPVGSEPRWVSERRIERIRQALTHAAEQGRVFHLWWHPHNFGARTAENLAALRAVLEHFRRMQSEYGMQSLSMIEAAGCSEPPPAGVIEGARG